MRWRVLQHRCSLELRWALQGALRIADRDNSPSVRVDHVLRAMAEDPKSVPVVRNIEGVDLFLEVLLTKLAEDACRRAELARGGDVVQIVEPGPNGSSHDNWNEPVNTDDDGQDQAGWINRR